ncbi:hypothetical protein [Rhodospirillum sp. A1_3_36]|uniref:hypothetical protein n=1 Tax=Rhodospirillum sp. A1_3_36 TaxID=3391666 RepID=UPI0039A76E86
MIYAINYDLNQPGQNYEKLHSTIKELGAWWHFLGSTWLVDTGLNAEEIWKRLDPHIDQNDNVLVVGITRDYSGWLPPKAWEWINDRRNKLAA